MRNHLLPWDFPPLSSRTFIAMMAMAILVVASIPGSCFPCNVYTCDLDVAISMLTNERLFTHAKRACINQLPVQITLLCCLTTLTCSIVLRSFRVCLRRVLDRSNLSWLKVFTTPLARAAMTRDKHRILCPPADLRQRCEVHFIVCTICLAASLHAFMLTLDLGCASHDLKMATLD